MIMLSVGKKIGVQIKQLIFCVNVLNKQTVYKISSSSMFHTDMHMYVCMLEESLFNAYSCWWNGEYCFIVLCIERALADIIDITFILIG